MFLRCTKLLLWMGGPSWKELCVREIGAPQLQETRRLDYATIVGWARYLGTYGIGGLEGGSPLSCT